jgi:hypothetical protein
MNFCVLIFVSFLLSLINNINTASVGYASYESKRTDNTLKLREDFKSNRISNAYGAEHVVESVRPQITIQQQPSGIASAYGSEKRRVEIVKPQIMLLQSYGRPVEALEVIRQIKTVQQGYGGYQTYTPQLKRTITPALEVIRPITYKTPSYGDYSTTHAPELRIPATQSYGYNRPTPALEIIKEIKIKSQSYNGYSQVPELPVPVTAAYETTTPALEIPHLPVVVTEAPRSEIFSTLAPAPELPPLPTFTETTTTASVKY